MRRAINAVTSRQVPWRPTAAAVCWRRITSDLPLVMTANAHLEQTHAVNVHYIGYKDFHRLLSVFQGLSR